MNQRDTSRRTVAGTSAHVLELLDDVVDEVVLLLIALLANFQVVLSFRAHDERVRKALIALAIVLTSCSGQVDFGQVVDRLRAQPTASATATDTTVAEAVKRVIERANEAQQKAFATGDSAWMRDTATADYYEELRRINDELARAGVISFALVRITWGDVAASGTSATATAYETWRTTYADGSQDQRTDQNDYTLVREGSDWKIRSDVQPSARVISPSAPTTAPTQPDTITPAQITDTSSNWSGYVANGGTFTSVTGTWTVPNVSATTVGADATWVGIGGVTGQDLIQAGTMATVTGSGAVSYEAWIEMLPASAQTVPLAVTAGDSITVTITEVSNGEWLMRLVNNTTSDTYERTVRYVSSRSTAEWVQEAPSTRGGIVPLDDFGTVYFTGASAVRDGSTLNLRSLGAQPVAMINLARQLIAIPSTIDSDGASFAVSRTSAPGTVTGGGRTRRRG